MEIVLIFFVIISWGIFHFFAKSVNNKWLKLMFPILLLLLVWLEPTGVKPWKVILSIVCVTTMIKQFEG